MLTAKKPIAAMIDTLPTCFAGNENDRGAGDSNSSS